MKIRNISAALLTAIFAFIGGGSLQSEVLTPEEAYNRLFENTEVPSKIKGTKMSALPRLIHTGKDASGNPSLYVFDNKDSGFMIVSADDGTPALLGYGDDCQSANPVENETFRWWLDQYGQQIEWLRRNAPSETHRNASTTYAAIGQKVHTQWNQREPYNNLCPKLNGLTSVTGCVATAMSQLMKYHNWPQKGRGSNSYTPKYIGTTLSLDFSKITFDWNNMTNTYGSKSTAAQKNAVANLMYAVGVSVEMDYSPVQSGASVADGAVALVNNFSYQKGILLRKRDYYTDAEWKDIVYGELSQNGPVLYAGQSASNSAHAFICDGYNQNGYFHINWGWGGLSDGYFLLDALNPPSQGVGGGNSGYNYGQYILARVQPDKGGTPQEVIPSFTGDGFIVSSTSSEKADNSEIRLGGYAYVHGTFWSEVSETISGKFALKATRSNGDVFYLTYSSFENKPFYGNYYYTVNLPANLPGGTYSVSPVASLDERTWYDVHISKVQDRTRKMIVHEGKAVFSKQAPNFNEEDPYFPTDEPDDPNDPDDPDDSPACIKVTMMRNDSKYYLDSWFRVLLDAENEGAKDFSGDVRVAFTNGEKTVAYGDKIRLDIPKEGSVSEMPYTSVLKAADSDFTPGDYFICVLDDKDNRISYLNRVTLNGPSSPSLSILGLELDEETTDFDSNYVAFKADIECRSDYLAWPVELKIFDESSETESQISLCSFMTEPIFLNNGERTPLAFSGIFDKGLQGNRYFASLFLKDEMIGTDKLFFSFGGEGNGVEDIMGESPAVISQEIYTLSGIRIIGEIKTPGIYIIRQRLADGTHRTAKIKL